jgi:GMP synthase-like glutamine amidotransferase
MNMIATLFSEHRLSPKGGFQGKGILSNGHARLFPRRKRLETSHIASQKREVPGEAATLLMVRHMLIGILQTGRVPRELEEKHGQYPVMFARLFDGHGFTFRTYMVIDGVFPGNVRECEGWLITGSAHGAYDDLPWIPTLEQFIRDAYQANVPIAGICFGHQIMAQALGGKVEKFTGGWGAGHMRYRMADGTEYGLNAMHQDQVTVRPADAQVICTSEFCENAGLAYKGSAISFQPHPEFDDQFMDDLLALRAGKSMSFERAAAARESLGKETDSRTIAGELAKFFRESVQVAA